MMVQFLMFACETFSDKHRQTWTGATPGCCNAFVLFVFVYKKSFLLNFSDIKNKAVWTLKNICSIVFFFRDRKKKDFGATQRTVFFFFFTTFFKTKAFFHYIELSVKWTGSLCSVGFAFWCFAFSSYIYITLN